MSDPLLILKQKIIKTDAVLKLLAEKTLENKTLQNQVQKVTHKYAEKNKEKEVLEQILKEHKLKLEGINDQVTYYQELQLQHQNVADKYTSEINSMQIKYQGAAKELEQYKKLHTDYVTLETKYADLKVQKKYNMCKTTCLVKAKKQAEIIADLKKAVNTKGKPTSPSHCNCSKNNDSALLEAKQQFHDEITDIKKCLEQSKKNEIKHNEKLQLVSAERDSLHESLLELQLENAMLMEKNQAEAITQNVSKFTQTTVMETQPKIYVANNNGHDPKLKREIDKLKKNLCETESRELKLKDRLQKLDESSTDNLKKELLELKLENRSLKLQVQDNTTSLTHANRNEDDYENSGQSGEINFKEEFRELIQGTRMNKKLHRPLVNTNIKEMGNISRDLLTNKHENDIFILKNKILQLEEREDKFFKRIERLIDDNFKEGHGFDRFAKYNAVITEEKPKLGSSKVSDKFISKSDSCIGSQVENMIDNDNISVCNESLEGIFKNCIVGASNKCISEIGTDNESSNVRNRMLNEKVKWSPPLFDDDTSNISCMLFEMKIPKLLSPLEQANEVTVEEPEKASDIRTDFKAILQGSLKESESASPMKCPADKHKEKTTKKKTKKFLRSHSILKEKCTNFTSESESYDEDVKTLLSLKKLYIPVDSRTISDSESYIPHSSSESNFDLEISTTKSVDIKKMSDISESEFDRKENYYETEQKSVDSGCIISDSSDYTDSLNSHKLDQQNMEVLPASFGQNREINDISADEINHESPNCQMSKMIEDEAVEGNKPMMTMTVCQNQSDLLEPQILFDKISASKCSITTASYKEGTTKSGSKIIILDNILLKKANESNNVNINSIVEDDSKTAINNVLPNIITSDSIQINHIEPVDLHSRHDSNHETDCEDTFNNANTLQTSTEDTSTLNIALRSKAQKRNASSPEVHTIKRPKLNPLQSEVHTIKPIQSDDESEKPQLEIIIDRAKDEETLSSESANLDLINCKAESQITKVNELFEDLDEIIKAESGAMTSLDESCGKTTISVSEYRAAFDGNISNIESVGMQTYSCDATQKEDSPKSYETQKKDLFGSDSESDFPCNESVDITEMVPNKTRKTVKSKSTIIQRLRKQFMKCNGSVLSSSAYSEIGNNRSQEGPKFDKPLITTKRKLRKSTENARIKANLNKPVLKICNGSDTNFLDTLIEEIVNCKDASHEENATLKNKTQTEGRTFKKPRCGSRLMNTPLSPVHIDQCDLDVFNHPPKIIPLEPPKKMNLNQAMSLFTKVLNFPKDETIVQEVAQKLINQDATDIANLALQIVATNIHEKPDRKYTPPAPVMTETQRILQGFMSRMEKLGVHGVMNNFLNLAELRLLQETKLECIDPIARLYVAVGMQLQEKQRLRLFCCDAAYKMGDLAVPLLFTILSNWFKILPLESDSTDKPLARVLVQIILTKDCVKPGYNLENLKLLLNSYHQYSKERRNENEFFSELLSNFKNDPSRINEFPLLLLCKNSPVKWTASRIETDLRCIIEEGNYTPALLSSTIRLIGHIASQFNPKTNKAVLDKLESWLSLLKNEKMPGEVIESVEYSLRKLPSRQL